MVFDRPHHRVIARALAGLDGGLLREHQCWFGGGTAITLRYGEFRESVDIDFLVSDLACYRSLRQLLTGAKGIAAIAMGDAVPLMQAREVRADQYGIRTTLLVAGQAIKFEIVLEGRIGLEMSSARDEVCGIATLTPLDMATSKLLANSDRWGDDGVFNRDVIDLAMMNPPLPLLRQAISKAEAAYGSAIVDDLGKAIDRLKNRPDWLERCMQALAMTLPKAVLWKQLRALRRVVR